MFSTGALRRAVTVPTARFPALQICRISDSGSRNACGDAATGVVREALSTNGCADSALAKDYTLKAGTIDKGTGAPTGWALRTLENNKAMEYPISQTVGLVGTGTPIHPSYTPQGYKDSGWYDPATKEIVCLEHSEKVGQ